MVGRSAFLGALTCLIVGVIIGPAAADDGAFEEVVFLPWGDGDGELGRTPAREDEQIRGPHGIAVGADGNLAIIDRVNHRALILDQDGEFVRTMVLPGLPGAAALLPGGALAVADDADRRVVRVLGGTVGVGRTPRWAQPPVRLVSWTDDDGRVVVEGLDGFQLRLPVDPREPEPHALERGRPSADGHHAAWVAWRDGGILLSFPPGEVILDPPQGLPGKDEGYGPGAVQVLATGAGTAVLLIEAVQLGSGPIDAVRGTVMVDADGARGPLVRLPDPGVIVVPGDVAALPDGTVMTLVCGDDGCSLLQAHVGGVEVGR
jgi:hypothetical protein